MPKVLIAEDDLLIADMLAEVLVGGGYDVCGIARTVDEAVELGKRHEPDLAILDIWLAEEGLGTDIPAQLKGDGQMGIFFVCIGPPRWNEPDNCRGPRAAHKAIRPTRPSSLSGTCRANRPNWRGFAAVPAISGGRCGWRALKQFDLQLAPSQS